MAKKITDENGNEFVEVKPWYKKWWIWVIAVVLVFVAIGMIGGGSGSKSSSSSATKSAKTRNTKKSDTTAASSGKQLKLSEDTFTIESEKDFNPNWTDSSWADSTFSIDKVRVIKIKQQKYYDGDKTYPVQGLIMVHFKIKAGRDISTYPNQGTIITDDGQQIDATMNNSDDYDGEIAKGVTKDGYTTFIFKKMSSASQFKTLRLKWDSNYETDDMDDDNSDKTFDITINL